MALNDISLSAGMRSNLISLQSTTSLLDRTQSRLSTGKKVNNALDNPTNFFASQAHTQRANDLSSRKDGMVEGIHSVNAADKGITAITSLIESANGLIQSARTSDTSGRVSLGMQFNTILSQIDQIANDSGYKGKNFLKGDSLNVLFNENGGSQLTIPTPTFEVTASALGISAATISTPAIVVTGISVGIGSESLTVGTHTAASASWIQNQTIGIGSESIVVGNHSAYPASIQINDNLIAASYYGDSLVLKSNGSVVAWGAGVSGVLSGALSGVIAVTVGGGVWGSTGAYALALKNDGTVVAWGDNTYGQVSGAVGLSGVVDIAAEGYFYSVAAKNDGSVVGWGGLSSDPVTVLAPAGAGIVAVAAGNWHTIGLRSNGSVVFLHGGSFVPPEALSGVVAIAAGDVYSMALKNDGSVIAWGDNTYGQVDVPSGLSGVVAIAAGGTYSLALKNDGSLVGWGNVSVPADALTGNMVPTYSDFKLSPNDILTGMTVISGGPNVYIAGVLATSGMYSISGITITLTTPIGLATPVTYDYNPGFTSTSTSPVTKKTTAFTLGTTLTTGQYITDVFINNSQIPVSGYSVSGVSIDFTSSYAPLSGQIVTANVYNPSAQSGAIGSYYSVFQLATNDVLSGMSVISGGPSVYVSGELAAIGTYSIAGNKITLTTPVGQNTPVTYDYNSGYTITSTSPVTTKATSFTLGSTLTTGQYITDLFINNSKIPASRYSVSGLSINFVPDYAPASGQVVTASVYHPATTGSWQTESGLDLATDQLATAINTLRNHSAALASNMSTVTVREDFTNSMIQTLLKGADNLTLADMDEEGANMLMLQTRQQLGTTSLQMASKAAQGVQRLFE